MPMHINIRPITEFRFTIAMSELLYTQKREIKLSPNREIILTLIHRLMPRSNIISQKYNNGSFNIMFPSNTSFTFIWNRTWHCRDSSVTTYKKSH